MKTQSIMSAEEVARIGYAGFKKGRRMVITGFPNKFLAHSAKFMPRAVLLPIIKRLQS